MKYSKVRKVKSIERGTKKSAGIDFFIPEDFREQVLLPTQSVLIPSGIKINIPKNHVLIMLNKSSIAAKKRLLIGAQVIDEDYQGEIHIDLHNVGARNITLKPGMKITQGILLPVNYASPEEVPIENLYTKKTKRGSGGFGSTNNIKKEK